MSQSTGISLTTTPTFEGCQITHYKGIVAGEAVVGANVVKDLLAGLTDFVGGRSAAYEAELERARETVLQALCEKAKRLGANAVVGVGLDYEVLGANNGMLMVAATGTAVVVD